MAQSITAKVTKVDHATKTAEITPPVGDPWTIEYDTIVMTAGAVSRTFPIPGVADQAIGLKTIEEAASSLGATRWQILRRVVLPFLFPAWLTGFALAFARAIGEYGSVVFIAGNMPMRTEITPLLIITQLEQFNYAAATAIAVVLLVISFALLLAINGLQAWTSRRLAA